MKIKYYLNTTLLFLIVIEGFIAFFQILHPQNHFIFHRKQKTFKTRQNSFQEQKVRTNMK